MLVHCHISNSLTISIQPSFEFYFISHETVSSLTSHPHFHSYRFSMCACNCEFLSCVEIKYKLEEKNISILPSSSSSWDTNFNEIRNICSWFVFLSVVEVADWKDGGFLMEININRESLNNKLIFFINYQFSW